MKISRSKFNPLALGLLVLIIILAAILRFYKLDQIPPSLNWDEAAAGYNAFTIANWGKDEWGQSFPLIFTSFRDDKHPVHIYTTALFYKLFGVSDFITRSSAATFGVLNVLLIFLLTKLLFKSKTAAFFAAFIFAISPYDIQFSRGLWETNFALFYFLLGLYLFYLGLQKNNWLITLSFISFVISMLSYHSSKVVVPVVILSLITLYFKQLLKLRLKFYLGVGFLLVFIVMMVLNPRLAGLARVNQTKFTNEQITKTQTFQKTQNKTLASAQIVVEQYFKHFSWDYLYQSGDQSPRDSIKVLGEFYKIELPFLLIGLGLLIWSRSRISLILLVWLAVAPLPSSLVQGAPNATRALFMLGVIQIIEGFAIAKFINYFKNVNFRYLISGALIVLLLLSLKEYTDYYFTNFAQKDAIEWQYGMKEVVGFSQKYPDYSRIFMTDVRSQPYIFFLYYLRYPLPQYLQSVRVNQNPKNNNFNTIYSFDKYQFGGWDEIQSMPDPGLVYVVEDSKYGGLAHKDDFARVEKVKFPGGGVAFYIVSKY